jgi:hypothetical protein
LTLTVAYDAERAARARAEFDRYDADNECLRVAHVLFRSSTSSPLEARVAALAVQRDSGELDVEVESGSVVQDRVVVRVRRDAEESNVESSRTVTGSDPETDAPMAVKPEPCLAEKVEVRSEVLFLSKHL